MYTSGRYFFVNIDPLILLLRYIMVVSLFYGFIYAIDGYLPEPFCLPALLLSVLFGFYLVVRLAAVYKIKIGYRDFLIVNDVGGDSFYLETPVQISRGQISCDLLSRRRFSLSRYMTRAPIALMCQDRNGDIIIFVQRRLIGYRTLHYPELLNISSATKIYCVRSISKLETFLRSQFRWY